MPKLTAAQSRSIETVMYHLDRANKYLLDDSVVLARKKSMATTTLDFTLPDGTAACPVDKEIGSDIAGLQMAMGYLKNFLEFHSK